MEKKSQARKWYTDVDNYFVMDTKDYFSELFSLVKNSFCSQRDIDDYENMIQLSYVSSNDNACP